jgi:hypothetical protein
MALRIRQLETTCRVPRRYRRVADAVDQFALSRFAADLAAHLGPSLSRQPAVVRIRRLPIRVVIPAPEFSEASLSKAWTAAFGEALFRALAYPQGVGPVEIFRAESTAKFVAGAIGELLVGTASSKWQYDEFKEIFALGATEGALSLLTRWPQLCPEILLELDQTGSLDRLLPRLDDLALERFFQLLATPADSQPHPLGLADLARCGRLILQHPPQKLSTVRSRHFALKLFVQAYRAREHIGSPCAIFHLALAWAVLLADDLSQLSAILQGDLSVRQVPSQTVALLQAWAHEVRYSPDSPQLAPVKQILEALRAALHLPLPSVIGKPGRVVSSDWCGLFFLTGTLERLGWLRAWQTLPEFQAGGVFPLLVGLTTAITMQFDPSLERLDAGLALFSGYVEEPDLRHVRSVFQECPIEVRRKVLRQALDAEDSAGSWRRAFEKLAGALLQKFTDAIPGFRRSSPGSIVRTFLRRKGRIRVEEDRMIVEPEPSAFHVALHIASLDAAIPSVSWLGDRRLEFVIEEP